MGPVFLAYKMIMLEVNMNGASKEPVGHIFAWVPQSTIPRNEVRVYEEVAVRTKKGVLKQHAREERKFGKQR